MASKMDVSSDNRLRSYKPTFKDISEARRLREQAQIKLRKDTRIKEFGKRRNFGSDVEEEASAESTALHNEIAATQFELNTPLPKLLQAMHSEDADIRHSAVQTVRKILSKAQDPPIQDVLDVGVLPVVIKLLQEQDHKIQFEACWVITNIASGSRDQTQCLIQEEGVAPLVELLLDSPQEHIREQAVWALGNIAGDGPELRDYVISKGIVPAMAKLFESELSLKARRNAAWTVSNLCRGKNPHCNIQDLKPIFNVMKNLLYEEDEDITIDICWAWSFIADGPNVRIQAIIESGVCPRLVELLLNPQPKVVTPALRTLGNIVTGNDQQTQAVLNCSVLEVMSPLLSHVNETIRKESCWMMSNILAGNGGQIQAVLDANLLPKILHLLGNDVYKIQKEACWSISNLTSTGSPAQIEFAVEAECIPPLCKMLSVPDAMVIQVALEALQNILKVGQMKVEKMGGVNRYASMIAEDGMDLLESLQQHQNQEVYQLAYGILDQYLTPHDEEEGPDDD